MWPNRDFSGSVRGLSDLSGGSLGGPNRDVSVPDTTLPDPNNPGPDRASDPNGYWYGGPNVCWFGGPNTDASTSDTISADPDDPRPKKLKEGFDFPRGGSRSVDGKFNCVGSGLKSSKKS